MKTPSYYELLTSDASEEIKNIPTSALKFSRSTAQVIYKDTTIENGKIHQKFPKVGDLLNYGKTPLMGLFVGRVKTYQELDEVILEVEEKLAKLGLKFKDSEFTVGDVRVKNLNLCPAAQKLINNYSHKIKTLDDLSTFGTTKIANFSGYNSYDVVLNISKELEKFGLKLEGSPYRIDKARFFPLDEFSIYLSEVTKQKIKKQEKTRNVNVYTEESRQALANMSKEELLATSIDRLPLCSNIKQTFDKQNIKTIGDLIHTNQNYIKSDVTHDQFITIENVLASLNLRFYNSDRVIVDGKVVRVKSSRITGKAPKVQNITELSKEEQDKFLDTKILEFGLAPYLEEPFKSQDVYKTMRDIVNSDKTQLEAVLKEKSIVLSISRLIAQYGFKMKKSNSPVIVSKYVDGIQIIRNNLSKEPNEEEKQAYLSMPLRTAGFTEELISVITDAGFKVETIEDVISHKRNEYFGAGITDAQIRAMRCILLHYGYTIFADENNYKTKKCLEIADTSTKENEYDLRKQKHKMLVKEYLEQRASRSKSTPSTEDDKEDID